jgi:DNA-binding response OmpR family regulator
MDNAQSKWVKGNLLIVDDDLLLLQTLDAFLTREGYKVRSAPNGQMALMSAVEDPPELILLDIRLPDMDGFQVCRRLKEDPQTGHIPVIMLTGHGSEEIAVEAMKAGVSDYLVKGVITSETLRLAISNALQKFKMQQEIEEQRRALLDAERQRVMMESVGAACHHFAQPLTTMLNYLQMLAKAEGIEGSPKSLMLEQCLKAAEDMKVILNKFQEVSEYRTRPYLADTKILDIGIESIYGTPEIPDDKNRP